MKRLLPPVIGSLVLLLSFQNCHQNSALQSSSANAAQQTKIEDPDLKMAQSLDILTQSENRKVSLDLMTGKLVQQDLQTGTREEKCLSESMRSAINDLLSNSSLCEFKPNEEPICAQVYGFPYADIHWGNKSVVVGESQSSCHKGPDLCGQDGLLLRGLLRDVVARWSEWSCDFKVVAN